MPPRTKSIQELENELAAKHKRLQKLQKQRNRLARDLEAVDREMHELQGGKGRPGPKPGQKKTTKKTAKKTSPQSGKKAPRRARRRPTGKPLVDYIAEALGKADGPMRVKEVVQAVQDGGYKSTSKDFYNIVAATLRDDRFEKVARGQYQLKT